MSDPDRHAPAGEEAPWRRWRMGELPTPRRAPDERPDREIDAREASTSEAKRRQPALEALRKQVRREAYEEGLHQGREAGHAEGLTRGLDEGRRRASEEFERRLADELAPLLPLARHFGAALETLDEALADDLVALALTTARQLAGEAFKARPRQVLELVRGLLHTEPPLVGQPRLWLHPLDHRLVEKHLGEELAAAGWTLQPDDQLSRGGCRVTSANGELDATWESRWKAVQEQVRKRRPARHDDRSD